jgi:long-chain fatty acid transport protein
MNMLIKRPLLQVAVALSACALPTIAIAGPYNFSDVLIGDRAMGMGGAFSGVADDSSALYYNPAGLGFATSANLSAAVNAFQYTRRNYQKVFAGKESFFEDSQDVIPSFTGGVIDLGKFSDGLHGAFTLQNLSQQSANQNDFIRQPELGVEFLHRAEKSQTSELVFSIGAGKRILSNLSFGLSVGGRQLAVDQQQFQDVTQKVTPKNVKVIDSVAASKTLYIGRALNTKQSATAIAAEFGGGLLWAPWPWLSIGFSSHADLLIKQSMRNEGDQISIFHYNDLSLPVAADFEALPNATPESVQKDIDIYSNKIVQRVTSNSQPSKISFSNKPQSLQKSEGLSFGRTRFRLGLAAFPSPKLMLTMDIAGYHSRTEWILSSGTVTDYVLNVHQGCEYFFTPQFFVRQGLFTNFDSRPEELNSLKNPERVDFAGASLFFGTQTSDSQFSLGGIYQYGWGKALKLEGQSTPTPVRDNKVLLAFTASHGL